MLSVYLRGDFANFADPRLKAEGGTFFVPPGSALRGTIEAVRFKPEVYVDVRRVRVLKPIKTVSCKVQGVDSKVGPRGAKQPVFFSKIQLMNMLFLCDVAYVVDFDLRLCRRERGEVVEFDCAPTPSANLGKYVEMYSKWIRRGKSFRQPFLGSKMCVAGFRAPKDTDIPWKHNQNFGFVTHGIEYRRSGNITHVCQADMRNGVIEYPSFFDVLKSKAGVL